MATGNPRIEPAPKPAIRAEPPWLRLRPPCTRDVGSGVGCHPVDSLSQLAAELTPDAALAERLVAEAKQRSSDEAEQRRVLTELVAAEKRAQAARRIERWNALQKKGALAFVPVVVAFVVGAALGGGLGVTRIRPEPEPDALVPDGRELPRSCRRLLAKMRTLEPRRRARRTRSCAWSSPPTRAAASTRRRSPPGAASEAFT